MKCCKLASLMFYIFFIIFVVLFILINYYSQVTNTSFIEHSFNFGNNTSLEAGLFSVAKDSNTIVTNKSILLLKNVLTNKAISFDNTIRIGSEININKKISLISLNCSVDSDVIGNLAKPSVITTNKKDKMNWLTDRWQCNKLLITNIIYYI